MALATVPRLESHSMQLHGSVLRRTCCAAFVLFLLIASAAAAEAQQRRQQPAPRTLDDVVLGQMEEQHIPGVVVAVVQADSVILLRAYGRTALSAEAPGLEEDALFRVAPVTEVLTALVASTLEAKGRLSLTRSLGTSVAGVPPELRAVSIAQLLSHTAGMAHQLAVPGRGGANDLGAAARGLTRFDRVTDPGLLYSFSQPGISLAALAVQAAGGRPYEELVETQVFRPLGMAGSSITFEGARHRLAPGWRSTQMPGERLAPVRPAADSAVYVPMRGLSSTAADLARLVAALLNDGVVKGERLLPEGAAARAWHVHGVVPASTAQAALGMRIGTWRERPSVVVAGARHGHSVLVRMLPAEQLGVVVLTNNESALMGGVSSFVLQSLLGLPDPQQQRSEAAPVDTVAALNTLLAHAGPYENGSELLEIIVVDGRPMLKSDDLVLDVRPLANEAYGALLGHRVGLVFRLVHDAQGRTYLWLGDRALSPVHVREPPR
jgi:CubicO group peptidase (beta-lactamase class C family)